MKLGNYDKTPVTPIPGTAGSCSSGWDAISRRIVSATGRCSKKRVVIAVECYPGVDVDCVMKQLSRRLQPAAIFDARQAMLPAEAIDALVVPYLGGDDLVFGYLAPLTLVEWFDDRLTKGMQSDISAVTAGVVLVCGAGATLVSEADVLIYADLARWEAQGRFRRNEASNLGLENRWDDPKLQYKRSFFIDWRVADRWKAPLIKQWDFVLDTHDPMHPKLVDGETIRRGLQHVVTRPFRVAPYFDPAPWGGEWMRDVCGLSGDTPNYGWCFDCVPEENSLLLGVDDAVIEMPSLNLVLHHPQQLLGEFVFDRFGPEFPIRFDLLDTMGGGNLSFQVHPLLSYIRDQFGMPYTQDESYYLLDAGDHASVYLGLCDGVNHDAMARDLRRAQTGEIEFDADLYANKWPAKKHDHFLIPAGACHCSGANSMVLEISATPYIFTFKMWDWGRLGLDGLPRPIHLDHGLANLQWGWTTDRVRHELINRVQQVASGPGWREEVTGLHETQFIETRRHWFTQPVEHDTSGSVNVLNLVDGKEATVESPDGAFDPFTVHYAETFIVPAAVGAYRIVPIDPDPDHPHATIKALVRRPGDQIDYPS